MRQFPSYLMLIGTLGACGLEMAKPVDGIDSGQDTVRDSDADDGASTDTDTDTDTDADTDTADEICGNGLDDDGDGHADCADDACVDEPGCVCIDAIATGSGRAVVSGDTTGSTDDRARGADYGCGSTASSAPDDAIAWTAPDAGCYAADTFGSGFDTVLRIIDGCDGDELACDDDSRDSSGAYTSQSQLLVGGSSGRAYTFVVDGFGGDDLGAYQLSIHPAAALADAGRAIDIASATGAAVATGSLDGSAPAVDHQCTSGEEAISQTFRWVAPITGAFTFATTGSDFDTVISVLDRAGCTELACDDDVQVGSDSTSLVELAVTEGETYLVAVSGYSGATGTYVLRIE